jgi:hypothetical protein
MLGRVDVLVVVVAALGCGEGYAPAADAARADTLDARRNPWPDMPERPAACDAPELKAAWDACRATQDEPSCVASGGQWVSYVPAYMACNCPTGQDGCPCASGDQCIGQCQAEWTPASKPDPDCGNVTWGRCTARNYTIGCGCWWSYGTTFQSACQD